MAVTWQTQTQVSFRCQMWKESLQKQPSWSTCWLSLFTASLLHWWVFSTCWIEKQQQQQTYLLQLTTLLAFATKPEMSFQAKWTQESGGYYKIFQVPEQVRRGKPCWSQDTVGERMEGWPIPISEKTKTEKCGGTRHNQLWINLWVGYIAKFFFLFFCFETLGIPELTNN